MTRRELQACRKRLERYAEEMFQPLGRLQRRILGQAYLRGLLLEGRRKSVQPMAQRLAPDSPRQEADEQALQQFLNQSPWDWGPVRQRVAQKIVQALGPGGGWIIDDTGFVKQGNHSVGVARQYSGTLGKTGNCQIGVSLSYSTPQGTMPLDWALYLPESWAEDGPRRARVGVPEAVAFQTKWELALALIDDARAWKLPPPEVVLADAAYGSVTEFREGLTERKLPYVVEVESTLAAWRQPQRREAPVRATGRRGRPRGLKYRKAPAPEGLKQIALSLPPSAWRTVTWREGTRGKMSSRFARVRVQPAHGWRQGHEELPEVWLLLEWPEGAEAPTKYWLSDLPEATSLHTLVRWARSRWGVEMNYRELKDHVGLDHFEGRGWRGWHHHMTLVMVAFGFVLLERLRQAKKGDPCRAFPTSWGGFSTSLMCGPESVGAASDPIPTSRGTRLRAA